MLRILSLLLSFGLGAGVGLYFAWPSSEAALSISPTQVVLTAMYISRKAPVLTVSVIVGAAVVLGAALFSAAYILKPRTRKD